MARDQHTDYVTTRRRVSAIDTDGSGQEQLQLVELRHIEDVTDVSVESEGGYHVVPVSIQNKNEVVVEVYESAGSNAEMALNTGGSGVTNVNIKARGV